MKKFNIKNLTYPSLAIVAASLLLFIILTILSFQNYHREKRLMEKHLLQHGLTLMRTLETGARTGVMGMWMKYMNRWNQTLSGKYIIVGLKMQEYETAQAEDIRRAIISAVILLILGIDQLNNIIKETAHERKRIQRCCFRAICQNCLFLFQPQKTRGD